MKISSNTIDAIAQLLQQLQDTSDNPPPRIVLIGGQALYLWAERYLLDMLTAEELADVTSFDLDFLASKDQIKICAAAWGETASFPAAMDSTPNSGIVYLTDEDGESVAVDFLNHVAGLTDAEVVKHVEDFPLSLDEREVNVCILSPPLCLKSRIHNLFNLGYGEQKKSREVVRIQVAIKACKHYILEFLNEDPPRIRSALNIVQYLEGIMVSRNGRRLFKEYGLTVLKAIPDYHTGWPEEFVENKLPRMKVWQEKQAKSSAYQTD